MSRVDLSSNQHGNEPDSPSSRSRYHAGGETKGKLDFLDLGTASYVESGTFCTKQRRICVSCPTQKVAALRSSRLVSRYISLHSSQNAISCGTDDDRILTLFSGRQPAGTVTQAVSRRRGRLVLSCHLSIEIEFWYTMLHRQPLTDCFPLSEVPFSEKIRTSTVKNR